MMKFQICHLLLFPLLLLFACEKDQQPQLKENEAIMGYWSFKETENDTIRVFERVQRLPDNNYGFGFETKGVFKERKNAGWCGTPPISYADYDGTWTLKDSRLKVDVPYWGGQSNYEWEILSLDSNLLKVYSIQEEYLMEHQ